ncbi:MAG: hypothetical protein RLZZ241_1478 [Bacteroidota bacterium]|jgi:hypothetical protein
MRIRLSIFVLLFAACAEKQVKQPEQLLSREQMVNVLYDIAALSAIEGNYPNALERNDIRIMEFVYTKYGIDSLKFAASDLYYASIPAEYEAIYEALEARMGRERDSISEAMRSVNEKSRANLQTNQNTSGVK